jgi:hypothetical protein
MNDNSFFPGCYYSIRSDGYHYFNGIIASSRMTKHKKGKKLMLFIGVGSKQYIQVNIDSVKFFDSRKVGIEGMGRPLTEVDKQCSIIITTKYHYY